MDELYRNAIDKSPMMANEEIDISGLVSIKTVVMDRQNLLGISLPVIKRIECKVSSYSYMARPYWVDYVAHMLKQYVEVKINLDIQEKRHSIL